MHLNHRTEPTRLKEIVSIRNSLNDIFEKNIPQIWTGDFNALTKEDYSSSQWNEITEVRTKNNWELPQIALTEKIKEYGFQDTWKLKPSLPIKTCRFDTRIDYIFATDNLFLKYEVQKVLHVDDTASDHNMVMTTFVKRK